MNVDAAGVQHEGEKALARLHAVANAPIFSFADVFFGRELVGGPMHSVLEGSRETATAAIRILGGEKAGASGYPPPDLQRRSSTGGKCSAGALAKAVCRREARSCFVIRQYGINTNGTSCLLRRSSWSRQP